MSFQCVNELEHFSFEDCQIDEAILKEHELEFVVEAIIVKANNTQNTNFTESYADTTQIIFQNMQIEAAVLCGLKYYDADERLISEVPDQAIDAEEIKKVLKQSSGAYLASVELLDRRDGRQYYELEIEFMDTEDEYAQGVGNSYLFTVSFDKAIVRWERYMNRVQR